MERAPSNDPKSTWRLASYEPPGERRVVQERRKLPRTTPKRRRSRRSLRSLLKL